MSWFVRSRNQTKASRLPPGAKLGSISLPGRFVSGTTRSRDVIGALLLVRRPLTSGQSTSPATSERAATSETRKSRVERFFETGTAVAVGVFGAFVVTGLAGRTGAINRYPLMRIVSST